MWIRTCIWEFTKIRDRNIDPEIQGSPYRKDPNKVPLVSETPHSMPTKEAYDLQHCKHGDSRTPPGLEERSPSDELQRCYKTATHTARPAALGTSKNASKKRHKRTQRPTRESAPLPGPSISLPQPARVGPLALGNQLSNIEASSPNKPK